LAVIKKQKKKMAQKMFCSGFVLLLALFSLVYISQAQKVRLDFFVMSKCPDAFVCETTYKNVISQVGSIVDLHVNYIASIDSSTETGFDCMHGQSECWGDIQQLCAYNLYPSNYTWWNFIQCQDQTQSNIPNNAASCAQTVGIDMKNLTECYQGKKGSNLMTQSINFTNSMKIEVCCTIYLQNSLFCVHDGTWRSCKTHQVSEIVQYICRQYTGSDKPPACKQD